LETFVLCPFRVGTLLWEAQPGQRSLTVIVKATFLLVPDGEAVPAPEQDPIGDDHHWEESALGSLHRPADLAPLKRRVDLSLVGHAFAPGGEPVAGLTARLRVGDFVKTLEIKGDRLWTAGPNGLVVGAPIPFVQMPLRYERAPLSPDNPVGVDVDAPPSLGSPALANLDRVDGPRAAPIPTPSRASVPPGRSQAAPAPTVAAVGFGPITPTWRPRRKLLDEPGLFWAYGVSAAGGAAGPAPQGFNFEFFNSAPRDQQIDMLRAGAVIELDNLSPTHPHLTTQLPAIRPQVFRIDPRTGRSEEIILRCDTLWIDTDRGVAVLTFRGLHDVGAGTDESVGKLLIAADPQGKKLRGDRVEQLLREQSPGALGPARASATAQVADPLGLRYDAVKSPREGAAAAPPPEAAAGPAKHDPTQRFDWQTSFPASDAAAPLPRNEEAIRDHTRDISQLPRRAPLPFQGAPRSEVAAFASAPTMLAPKEIPLDLAPREAPVRPTEPPPPMVAAATDPPAPIETLPPPPMVAAATDPPAPIETLPPPPMVAIATIPRAPDLAAPMTMRGIAPPLAVPAAPAVPDLGMKTLPFGLNALAGAPLALARPAEPAAPAPTPPAVKPIVPSAPSGSTRPLKTAPMEPDPAPETVPIERYAGISAALSRKGVDRGAVLRSHKLTIAGWGAIDRHWKRALAEQTDRGEKALLHAFDVAYVEAQGELHRPVGVREYARILIGLERGEVGRVLADLELQLSDLMRLQRVWSKRVAEAPDLAAELATALEEVRKV
jgi:hypothetical protein